MTAQSCRSRLFPWVWLMALMAIAAYIRVDGANDYYYAPDEVMHTRIAAGETLSQVLEFAHYEIHPPVLYVLAHYWMRISTNPAFVRGLALIFGLLIIPLYYLLGKKINGEMTGMCCALLIAYGNGCIIQSYVVRHYIILIFFVSLAFYCYLCWRDTRRLLPLLGYGIFSLLACMTHFSGIFDVFCIGSFECIALRQPKEKRGFLFSWIVVNGLVAMAALYVYRLWQPILVPLKSYFATHLSGSTLSLLIHTLFYPLVTPGYILPNYTAALILLIAQVWVIIAPPRFIHNIGGLRSMLTLNASAYALGMLLVLTHLYPEPGTRHSFWILPFVVLTAGWILGDASQWLATELLKKYPGRQPIMACLLLVAGLLTYSPENRFHDGSEYVWHQKEWRAFSSYMEKLGPRDLIVTERDDGIMLANLYLAMGSNAFSGKQMAALMPYQNTHILFNPYYPRNYSRYLLLATLQEAQTRHMFDGVDRLIFLRMAWSRSPLTDWMLCDAVEKQIVTFPPISGGGPLTRIKIYGSLAAIMIVPKEPFLHDALSADSKTHACLDGLHDPVPNLLPYQP